MSGSDDSRGSNRPLTILVVEDDPHLRKLCAFALGLDKGISVATCESGEQALERIEAETPNLVLLDLEMPGIGGLETARRLPADIPFAIMTGKPKFDVSTIATASLRGILKKPFDPMTLAAEVRKLVAAGVKASL